MTDDIDLGCGVLEIMANSDEGRQIAAINEEFAEARRKVLSLPVGSGKITMKMTLNVVVENEDEMTSKLEFDFKRPTRKQKVADKVFLDTEKGLNGQEIVGTTMHIGRKPRQQVISYPSPALVPGKDSN